MTDNIVLQPDDRELLLLFSRDFLLLSDDAVAHLFPHRSPRALRMRLKKLAAAHFVQLFQPIESSFLSAARPLYYLGPKGQHILDPERKAARVQLRVKQARSVSVASLPHRLFADAIHITFRRAKWHYPDYTLLEYIPQYDPVWKTLLDHGLSVHPDGYAEYTKAGRTFHCFIEADRGTYRGIHLTKRLQAYAAYAKSGTFQLHFSSDSRFRVLFIATSPGRVRHLLHAARTCDPDLFWVATRQDFDLQPLFQAHWLLIGSSVPHALDEPLEPIPEPPDAALSKATSIQRY
jgi:hypothetical protein